MIKSAAGHAAILLLGADGQIGYELRSRLAQLGSVAAPAHSDLDLANGSAIRQFVRAAKPSLIVNAAAYTDVDGAETAQGGRLAMAVNGEAMQILGEEAADAGAAVIHYSTDYVFDGTARRPYAEADVPSPVNAYGRSKLAGEIALARSGAAYLTLRTSWVYAARGRNFLRAILRLAAEQDELRVVDDQIGCPNWARSVAEATVEILNRCFRPDLPDPLSGRGGIYHLAGAGETSWHGFAEAIVAAAGNKPIPVRAIATAELPRPAKRPAYSVLDSGKAARTFGVRLPHWQDMLTQCLADMGVAGKDP